MLRVRTFNYLYLCPWQPGHWICFVSLLQLSLNSRASRKSIFLYIIRMLHYIIKPVEPNVQSRCIVIDASLTPKLHKHSGAIDHKIFWTWFTIQWDHNSITPSISSNSILFYNVWQTKSVHCRFVNEVLLYAIAPLFFCKCVVLLPSFVFNLFSEWPSSNRSIMTSSSRSVAKELSCALALSLGASLVYVFVSISFVQFWYCRYFGAKIAITFSMAHLTSQGSKLSNQLLIKDNILLVTLVVPFNKRVRYFNKCKESWDLSKVIQNLFFLNERSAV